MFRKIQDIWSNVTNGVHNLIVWFPVIWKDRDYAENYLMSIIQFKLERMSRLHREHGHLENSEEYARQLSYAAELASKIAEADYTDEVFGDKKYLLEKMSFEFDEDQGLIQTGLTEEEREEVRRLMDREEEFLERDLNTLLEYINRHYFDWWD